MTGHRAVSGDHANAGADWAGGADATLQVVGVRRNRAARSDDSAEKPSTRSDAGHRAAGCAAACEQKALHGGGRVARARPEREAVG